MFHLTQQQPRIIQSLRGMSPPYAKQTTSKLLTMHSMPEDIIKHYSWTSDQPRVNLKQAPTTTTTPTMIKWANHPSRLNGNKSLDPMPAQLLQARQRLPKGDAPTFASMASLWGLEPDYITKLSDKALCLLIVVARLLTEGSAFPCQYEPGVATLLRRDLRLKTCMPLTCALVMTCEFHCATSSKIPLR